MERQQIESENWDNRLKVKLFKLRIDQSDLSAHLLLAAYNMFCCDIFFGCHRFISSPTGR